MLAFAKEGDNKFPKVPIAIMMIVDRVRVDERAGVSRC